MRPHSAKEEEFEFLEESLRLSKYLEHMQEPEPYTDNDNISKVKLEKVSVVLKCEFLREKVKMSDKASLDSKSSSIETEDGEKQFCDLCEKFVKKKRWYRHKIEVHSNERFSCTLCPKRKFKYKKGLKYHMRHIHKDQNLQNPDAKDRSKEEMRKKSEKPKANSSPIDEISISDTAFNTRNKEPNNNVQNQQTSQQVNVKKEQKKRAKKVPKVPVRKLLVPAPASSNSIPKRFARCGTCPPCLAKACGECHSCKMWARHKNKAVDSVACERNTCENPIGLFGSKVVQDQHRQMDGVCPLREINGQVYDFRCYICKVLPRVGSANRSELYRHYTLHHYTSELRQEFGTQMKSCPHCHGELNCKKGGKSGKYISHLGQVHNEVEKYIPHQYRIPIFVQGKGGRGRRIRRRQAEIKSRATSNNVDKHWFPEVPKGWNPKGGIREIFPTDPLSHFSQTVVIDGFTISNELDEDVEPLMVTRGEEEENPMPDYEDSLGGRCLLCRDDDNHASIYSLVHHVHVRHEILGGSQYLMLDADRLLKGGYISIN